MAMTWRGALALLLAAAGAVQGAAALQPLVEQDYSLIPAEITTWCNESKGICNDYVLSRACFTDSTNLNPSLTLAENTSDVIFVGVVLMMEAYPIFSIPGTVHCAIDKFTSDGGLPDGVSIEPIFILTDSTPVSVVRGHLCLNLLGGKVSTIIGPHNDVGVEEALTHSNLFNSANFLSSVTSKAIEDSTRFPLAARIGNRYSKMTSKTLEFMKQQGIFKYILLTFGDDSFNRAVSDGAATTELELGMRRVSTFAFVPDSPEAVISSIAQQIKASRGKIVLFMVDFQLFAPRASMLRVLDNEGLFDGTINWFGHVWQIYMLSQGINPTGQVLSFSGIATESDYAITMEECQQNIPTAGLVDERFANLRGVESIRADVILFDTAMTAFRFATEVKRQNVMITPAFFQDTILNIEFAGATGKVSFDDNYERPEVAMEWFNYIDEQGGNAKIAIALDGNFTYLPEEGENIPVIRNSTWAYMPNTTGFVQDFDMDCSSANAYTLVVSECHPRRTVSKIRNSEDSIRYCPEVEDYDIPCDHVEAEAVALAIVIAVAGVLITLLMSIFLLVNWRHPMVVSGQRGWLLVMCIGALICQTSFFLELGGTDNSLRKMSCILSRHWLATGSTLMLGALVVKLWRLKRVMLAKTFRKTRVGHFQLVINIVALVVVMNLIVFVGEVASSTSVGGTVVFTKLGDPVVDMGCVRDASWPNLTSVGFVALLAIYSCMLANEARHLSSALSEGTFVFVAVYNATLSAAVVFAFASMVDDSELTATMMAIGLLLSCSGTIILILFKRFQLIVTLPRDTNWQAYIMAGTTRGTAATTSMATTSRDSR